MFGFSHFASPVVCDSFSHSGDRFYVTLEGHRHERADSGSLYRLLTYTEPPPLLTKAGKVAKRQPAPHKDLPGHFYCAQLVHYGLKPSKTKEAAKKRLLAAFAANGTLSVPEPILKLEETLQEDYRQANEIAEKKYEEDEKIREIEEKARRESQMREQDAIMQAFLDAGDLEDSPSLKESQLESTENEISQVQLRDYIATLSEKQLRKILATLVDEIPAVERAMMKEVGKLHLPGKGKAHDANLLRTTVKMQKEKGKQKSKSQKLSKSELEGQFQIVAPYLSEQWSDHTETMTLKVCPSSTASHLWASFDFGIVSGVIRSTLPPPATTSTSCPFLWRGHESGEGEMSFGPDNQGSITFLGNGKIKGRMEWMAGFDFVGVKVKRENVMWVKSVKSWKATWRGINERAYESERVGRWGRGWTRVVVDDKPSISDTTSGGGSGDLDEDDQGSDYDMFAF